MLGLLCFLLLRSIDSYATEILLSLAVVTGGYALAMKLHLSGPLAMVVAGLILGNHGRTLNLLVKDLKEDKFLDEQYPHLLEKIGHTPAQVLVGSLIGFLISLTGYYLLA